MRMWHLFAQFLTHEGRKGRTGKYVGVARIGGARNEDEMRFLDQVRMVRNHFTQLTEVIPQAFGVVAINTQQEYRGAKVE